MFIRLHLDMCKLCSFVQQDPPCWTCMGKSYFQKLNKQSMKSRQTCENWAMVQKQQYCFHQSHGTPTTWVECEHNRLHESDMLFLMHPNMAESLPEPLVTKAFQTKIRMNGVGAKRSFCVDIEVREKYHSQENKKFAKYGYSSLSAS